MRWTDMDPANPLAGVETHFLFEPYLTMR
eukprot:COSAG06_NODE_34473_length_474_cov_0.674667_1_plen_28_part_01